MMQIEYVKWDELKPAPWRATHMLKPDIQVLADSLHDYGWISPIIVQKSTMHIIDGFHRWICAQADKKILKRDKKLIPVIYVDVDSIDAMVMHISLNRGRGSLVAKHMSAIIQDIYHSGKYGLEEIKNIFSMSYAEINLMMDSSIIKQRKITEYSYSKAWVPIEAPTRAAEQIVEIEKPPNKDR
jgi:ParB-like chromosome segregation protein Spo0J